MHCCWNKNPIFSVTSTNEQKFSFFYVFFTIYKVLTSLLITWWKHSQVFHLIHTLHLIWKLHESKLTRFSSLNPQNTLGISDVWNRLQKTSKAWTCRDLMIFIALCLCWLGGSGEDMPFYFKFEFFQEDDNVTNLYKSRRFSNVIG